MTAPAPQRPAGLAGSTFHQLHLLLVKRARKWLGIITLMLGLLSAVAVGAGTPAVHRSFATLVVPSQSLMSITVAFLGVLLVTGLPRDRGSWIAPRLCAAALLAVAVALFGLLVCVVATAVGPAAGLQDRWRHAGYIMLGSASVQALAALVGTGLGLLVRPPALAMTATIVLPLGLWFLLGTAEVTRPAQGWLTPYASVGKLLSGLMSPLSWGQWSVAAVLWGVGLNGVGVWKTRRFTPTAAAGVPRAAA